MKCFCGCGRKVPRANFDVNMTAAKIALELFVWDRSRSYGRFGVDAPRLESTLERGAGAYRRLIAMNHGELPPDETEGEAWLLESLEAREDRPEMTAKGRLMSRGKLKVDDEELEHYLDREHPDRSFTGREPAAPEPETDQPPTAPQPDPDRGPDAVDLAEQLERIGRLHAAGVLDDEEFAAAKRRIIDAA